MLCVGMIFCCGGSALGAPSPDVSLALATELYQEGDWPAARREALRALVAQPDNEAALMLSADCALRIDPSSELSRSTLDHLSVHAADPALRARAAYRVGQAYWGVGDLSSAWTAYARAFQGASDRALFLQSGCALFLLQRENSQLGADNPALLQQLATCRNLWNFDLRDEVRVTRIDKKQSSKGRPAAGIVAFYRTQIRPAIGHRCSLEPSCSEFFLQASRTHGWLGLPLIGDRLVREPGVVQAAAEPVDRNGVTHYRDPLINHTDWLKDE